MKTTTPLRRLRSAAVAALLIAAGAASINPANAGTITVNSLLDNGDSTNCTLREAVALANSGGASANGCSGGTAAPNTINLPTGTIRLVGAGAAGYINITSSMTISGDGPASTIIAASTSGARVFENFNVAGNTDLPTMSLTLQNLTISGGRALTVEYGHGAALYVGVNVTTTITNCVFNNNVAEGSGGAIETNGILNITNSTFSNNQAKIFGGAIESQDSKITINGSTFVSNQAADAGAINFVSEAATTDTLVVNNSTFSGNMAKATTVNGFSNTGPYDSGALRTSVFDLGGGATLTHVTLTGNSAADNGGAITGPLTLGRSILAGNTAVTGPDCSGTITSNDYNVIGNVAGCTIAGTTTNNVTGSALLDALASNGGPTQTHKPQAASPAVNRIPATCNGTFTTDQRGVTRPQRGTACDSGAYELDPTVPGAPTIGTATAGDTQITVSFTAPSDNGGATITDYKVTCGAVTESGTQTTSPVVVTGLTNGTAYTCTVKATNSAGDSAASSVSNSATPTVALTAQTISFTSTAPTAATVGGTTYTPAATATSGLTVAFTIDAASSSVCAISTGTVSFNAAGTCTINANQAGNTTYSAAPQVQQSFTVTQTYTATASTNPASGANGSISPASRTVNSGSTTTFTVTPNAGYSASVASGTGHCGGTLGALSGGSHTYTTNAITANCTVVASFTLNTYTVTAVTNPSTGANGSITPASQTVNHGSTTTFTVTPNTGYSASASGCSGSLSGNTYTTGTITAACTVTASFALNLPGAPTGVSATPSGSGGASVSFTAPANSVVSSYTATCGSATGTGNGSPITVTNICANNGGVCQGTVFNCSVTATNGTGTGSASGTTTVTPVSQPGAPTIVTATAGNAQISVAFSANGTGGSAITGYSATCTGAGTFTGVSSPIVVTGLSNGTAYTCTAKAINAIGTSAASVASGSVTPAATPPSAPIIGIPTAGNARATIAFAPPEYPGGTITSYTATCGTFSASGATTPITVTGLTNGIAYSCSVTASNAGGTGPASRSVSVTPIANPVPNPPTAGAVTNATAQVSIAYTAPTSNGGTAVLDYTATCTAGTSIRSQTGTVSPLVVTGMTGGLRYSCSIKARNAAGSSAASNVVRGLPN